MTTKKYTFGIYKSFSLSNKFGKDTRQIGQGISQQSGNWLSCEAIPDPAGLKIHVDIEHNVLANYFHLPETICSSKNRLFFVIFRHNKLQHVDNF